MSSCRVCGAAVAPFISFGRMPLANGFLRREDFASEQFSELAAGFCDRCAMAQLVQAVPRERMFHHEYPFFTSSSARMSIHFRDLAEEVARSVPQDGFVVEIGSNDGTLLQHFAARGIRHLGVDPSENVAEAARQRGVSTWAGFFDEQAARDIAGVHGPADVILAANCFCHIADVHSLAAAVRILLKPEGLLIFEDPYLGDILRLGSYDQIYDEHAFYFSVTAVSNWLARHDLEVIDAQPQAVHGGSMRYTVARRGRRARTPATTGLMEREREAGLLQPETYVAFAARVRKSRKALVDLLQDLRRQGKRVAGYGATSKSTTVLNYCGIGADLVEFISDTTPQKQGRYSPGAHVPVRSPAGFRERYPEYALLFAWNHAEEILAKERDFAAAGGKWIVYVPEVKVL